MRPHNILLVITIAVVICIIPTPTTAKGSHAAGGWKNISLANLKSPKVLEIARWALAEHARQANDVLQLKVVLTGFTQVVSSGRNWRLLLDTANGDGKDGMYKVAVYDEPSTHTRKLTSFVKAD